MATDNPLNRRSDFLLKVYETYNQEIARHFGLAWQAVSIFAASLVAIASATVHSEVLPTYIVVALYIVLVTWAIEVVLDASFWYNRNLVVIANIERQFLTQEDSRNIHWYFIAHRPKNRPITFMRSLLLFLIVTALIVVAFYLVYPAISGINNFYNQPQSYVPLLILFGSIAVLRGFSIEKNKQYAEFMANAPGIDLGELDFRAPEHDFSERTGLSLIARGVTGLENRLLKAIGIDI